MCTLSILQIKDLIKVTFLFRNIWLAAVELSVFLSENNSVVNSKFVLTKFPLQTKNSAKLGIKGRHKQ